MRISAPCGIRRDSSAAKSVPEGLPQKGHGASMASHILENDVIGVFDAKIVLGGQLHVAKRNPGDGAVGQADDSAGIR
jgi:hypothetical protein